MRDPGNDGQQYRYSVHATCIDENGKRERVWGIILRSDGDVTRNVGKLVNLSGAPDKWAGWSCKARA